MFEKLFGKKGFAKKGEKETVSIESIDAISMVLEMKKNGLQMAILSGDASSEKVLKEQITYLEKRLASAR